MLAEKGGDGFRRLQHPRMLTPPDLDDLQPMYADANRQLSPCVGVRAVCGNAETFVSLRLFAKWIEGALCFS